MKKLIALFVLLAAPAFADVTIAAGKLGGGYDAFARALEKRLDQRGLPSAVQNLDGSDAITLALCAGEAQIGITQIDAMFARALEGCNLRPVGTYGEEVALILFPPKSKLSKLDQLTSEHKVLVDTIGSGTDLFWRTIVGIETGDQGNKSKWAQAQPVNDMISMANTLASFGDIHAVIVVRKPDSPDIANLIRIGWTIGEMWDKDINDQKFNDVPLYASSKIEVRVDRKRFREYGYTVRSFIVSTLQGDDLRKVQMALQ